VQVKKRGGGNPLIWAQQDRNRIDRYRQLWDAKRQAHAVRWCACHLWCTVKHEMDVLIDSQTSHDMFQQSMTTCHETIPCHYFLRHKVLFGYNKTTIFPPRNHFFCTIQSIKVLYTFFKTTIIFILNYYDKPRQNGRKMTSFRWDMEKLGAGVDNELGGSAPHQCR